LSPQNEPLFQEPYNSCVYTGVTYTDMLKAVGPIIHDSCPTVKIFGPEHMLFGVGKDYDFANLDPSGRILADSAAKKQLDIWACHGYGADGVTPTANNLETQYWTKAWQRVGAAGGTRMWMTETSGYGDDWASAMDYVESIHAALFHGHASAWVHWYGAGDIVTKTALTAKGTLLKHYARFVRPGAKALQTGVDDAALFCTAFKNSADGSHVIVVINSAAAAKSVTLSAEGLPAQFRLYQSSASERCVDKGTVTGTAFSAPAASVVTLFGTSGSFARNRPGGRLLAESESPAGYFALNGQALRSPRARSQRQVMIVRSAGGSVRPVVRLR
jgi:O-glycosyl hydrolase